MLKTMDRRTMLRATGVALALPWLDAMQRSAFAAPPESPRRMLVVFSDMGFMSHLLFPKEAGKDYKLSPYLELLKEHRDRFTIFSGLSHPEVDGGHEGDKSFLTGAPHPGQQSFRNSISLDNYISEKIGNVTRYPTLNLRIGHEASGLSWTRAGVMLPPQGKPSEVYKQLFVQGTEAEVAKRLEELREGRSLLDAAVTSAKALEKKVGPEDKRRLDEYFTSVRELEQRMKDATEWEQKPKPKVDAKMPVDSTDNHDTVGRSKLMYEMIRLALMTDSTRIVTVIIQEFSPNHHVSTVGHHDLTHHGNRKETMETLEKLERNQLGVFNELLTNLRKTKDAGTDLLQQTAILHGSAMGNANAHSNDNLPILLAGGGFKHGQHLAFDAKKNTPLANLYVNLIQWMGVDADKFASSTGTLRGLEKA